MRWLHEIHAPTLDAIPEGLRQKLDDPELYFQILEHRWYLLEKGDRDVGTATAIRDYIDTVLTTLPDRSVGGVQEPYPEP